MRGPPYMPVVTTKIMIMIVTTIARSTPWAAGSGRQPHPSPSRHHEPHWQGPSFKRSFAAGGSFAFTGGPSPPRPHCHLLPVEASLALAVCGTGIPRCAPWLPSGDDQAVAGTHGSLATVSGVGPLSLLLLTLPVRQSRKHWHWHTFIGTVLVSEPYLPAAWATCQRRRRTASAPLPVAAFAALLRGGSGRWKPGKKNNSSCRDRPPPQVW